MKQSLLTLKTATQGRGISSFWHLLLRKTQHLRLDIIFPLQLSVAIHFLKFIGNTKECGVLTKKMCQLPDNTLGKQLYLLMKENCVTLVPWYKEHDLKHILLGYGMNPLDEMRMQCFMWGNSGLYNFNTFISFFFIIWTPEMWADAKYHFKAGQLIASIKHYRIADCIDKDLEDFRKEIQFKKSINYFNSLNQ